MIKILHCSLSVLVCIFLVNFVSFAQEKETSKTPTTIPTEQSKNLITKEQKPNIPIVDKKNDGGTGDAGDGKDDGNPKDPEPDPKEPKDSGPQSIVGSPNNASQSPTASAEVNFANRFQDIPVNLFTGTPQIGFPIYTLSEGSLSVPITMSYNASGMKAHELASWCGLNWQISSGILMVNRIVRGIPDEGKLEYIALGNNNSTTRKGYYQWGVKDGNDEENDPEPDLYFFTVNGMSYKFTWVKDANGTNQASFFPEADIKVSVTYEHFTPLGEGGVNSNIGRFKNWKFLMPDGTTYLFATRGYADTEGSFEVEAKTAYNNNIYAGGSELNRYVKNNQVTSAWYLTQMASSYGHKIDFYYKQSQYSFFKLAEQEIQTNNCDLTGLEKNVNRVFVNGATISLIESKNIQVEFNKGVTVCYIDNDPDSPTYQQEVCNTDDSQIPNRADIDTWSRVPSFSSGGKLLSNIVVHDKADAVNKLEWKFNYSYFNSGGSYGTEPYFYPLQDIQTYLKSSYRFRLKLDKITLPDNNNYKFDYYAGDFDIPSRMTNGVDHWGFMNGAAGGGASGNLIGHDEYRNCTAINSSTRSATVAWSQYGTLQKIKSSIGAETSFVYENHSAYNYLDVSSNPKLVGGSRVTEIRNKDLISGIETLKKYDYTDVEGTTSGFMVLKPIYHWYAYPGTTEYINSGLYGMLLSESGRPAVGYNRVTEKIVEYTGIAANNLGSTITEFDQLLQEINVFDGTTGYIRPYRSFVPFHEYRIGSPKKITVKNSSGQTLLEKEYTYSTAVTTIPNLSAFRSFRLNNVNYNFQRGYTQGFSKYRLSSETSRAFSQDGTNPVENITTYTYKDEMDNAYKTKYPGRHNQVVKTTTTDSYGYSIVNQNKITADFDFGLDYTTVCYNMSGQEVDCNDMDVVYSVQVPSPHEPTNTEAKGIFKALQRHILYAPVESFTTKNGNLIGASYQTYYSDSTATNKPALPYQSFGLENVPKALSAFTEVLYTQATETFPKDAAYDLKGTTNEYNSLGFPTKMSIEYGSTSKTDYDVNEVLPIKTYNNLGEYSEQTQEMTYSPIIFGVKKQTSANGLELNNEYYSDGKLKQQTDKDGNVLKHIEYVYKGNDDLDSKVTTDTTYNRIITRVPRIATSDATTLDYQDCMISVQYKDGSGRALMSVDYKASPNAKDLISGVVIYDSYGRPSKTYLPVESTKADGSYTSPATVLTTAIAFYNDDNPFTEIKEYEASPMSRVFSAYGAGKAWRDNSKYTQSKYETATGIKKMTLAYNSNAVTISTYSTYELSKNTSIDERGSTVTTYTDKSGNTIQRDVQVDDSNYLITSYLYDDAGRMRYILPPKAYNALGSLTSIPDMETWSEFNENVYANHFDGRSRIYESHKPGIGWSRMVYNRMNKPVLSQDQDEEAKNNTWNYVQTDGIGRNVRTGQMSLPSTNTRANLQILFDNFTDAKQFEERSTVSGNVQFYTNRCFPSTLRTYITDITVKTVSYYDDYLWRTTSGIYGSVADYNFQANPYNESAYSVTNARGAMTGGFTKIEIFGDFLFPFVSYFDDKNRTIQSINYQNLLARNQSDIKYNFIGEPLQSQMIYRKQGASDNIRTTEQSLDHIGRRKDLYYTLKEGATNKVPRFKMISLSYDNIGRLKSKGIQPSNSIGSKQTGLWTDVNTWLSGILPTITDPVVINQGHIVTVPTNQTVTAGSLYDKGTITFQANSTLQMGTLPSNNTGSALQVMSYSYNVRGQMIGTNLDGTGNVSTSADRLFSYKLDYHEDSRYFDGSISKQTWKTNPLTVGGTSVIQTYEYTYDRSNRLLLADFTGTGTENYDVSMVYDENGNINTLQRNSKTGANTWGLIDNLSYNYFSNGNRLQKVEDSATNDGFKNGTNGGDDYEYYPDGKLKKDLNREISQIDYNFLDLVSKVTRSNGDYIEYKYTSTGTKRQTKRSIGGTESYTLFDGEMIYTYTGASPSLSNFIIAEVQNEEGRFVNNRLEYGYTDYLGNLRLSFRDSSGVAVVVQSGAFDPWGLEIKPLRYLVSGATQDKYTWQGKEDLTEDGLEGWSDFGWRIEDRTLGRWFTPDPDDQFDGMSQYAYCGNNPISHIDPDGRFLPLLMFALFSGHISGMIAESNGGNYGKSFAIGAVTSLIGGAVGAGVSSAVGFGNTLLGSVARGALGGLISGGVSGGVGSLMSGGNFLDGALNGGISGAVAGGVFSGADFLHTKAQLNATKARFAGATELQAKGVKPVVVRKMEIPELRPIPIPQRTQTTVTGFNPSGGNRFVDITLSSGRTVHVEFLTTFGNANNRVNPELVRVVEETLERADAVVPINSIEISATTNGTHSANSLHYTRNGANAIDISGVNGTPANVGNNAMRPLQNAFEETAGNGFRENFGPSMNLRSGVNLRSGSAVPAQHRGHIHWSIRR